MLKVVLDANVWISALIGAGNPREIITAFKAGAFHAFYPNHLLVELPDALARPKLRGRLTPDDVAELLDLIKTKAILIEPEVMPTASPDPKDNPYLGCAESGECEYLVTGDHKHLLVLGQFGTTRIVAYF